MITRLFKSKKRRLDSTDPADRLAALASISEAGTETSQAELSLLTQNDTDPGVRLAALKLLTDDEVLGALLHDELFGQPAAERLAALLSEGQPTQHGSDPRVLKARMAAGFDLELIEDIASLGDLDLLIDCALSCPRDLRETLLSNQSFGNAAVLQELERRSRDKNKTLNRFARSKLEEIRRLRSHSQRLTQRARELLESLDKPANNDTELRKWRALFGSLDSELTELKQTALTLAQFGEQVASLDSLGRDFAALAQSERKQQADAVKAPRAEGAAHTVDAGERFEILKKTFEALEQELQHNPDFEAHLQRRQVLTDQWLAAADHVPPTEAQHAVFERVSHNFQELSDAHHRLQRQSLPALEPPPSAMILESDQHVPADFWRHVARFRGELKNAKQGLAAIAWPEWAPAPEPLERLLSNIDKATAYLEASQQALQSAEADAADKLDELSRQIDDGELRAARSTASLLRQLLSNLPNHSAQSLNRTLSQESARLSELSDWQTFATTPKRESLCDIMEKLVAHPLAPVDQAHRIKVLRGQWNELGPVSRASDHRLLEKFNDLAEQAFKPCRSYFSEQADIRADNLRARENICDQLQNYLDNADWQHMDYRAAERILRTARQEWRNFHPVDRTPGKPLEARFEKLQSRLHEQIKGEWDRNLELKRTITSEARSLLEQDLGIHEKIEAAKTLQIRWKSVGVTPRRPDQALWREFRQACDDIFKGREDARRSAEETISSNRQTAMQLIDELRSLVDALDTAIEPHNSTLSDLQNRFNELPALPERLQRTLDRQWSELVKSYRLALKDAESSARQQHLIDLKALDIDVSVQEMRHHNGQNVHFEPPDPVFSERWTNVDNDVPLESLRNLVINTEIAARIESPEADRSARLSIQVELMNAGRARQVFDVDPGALVNQWCEQGPKDDGVSELRERFFSAIATLTSR